MVKDSLLAVRFHAQYIEAAGPVVMFRVAGQKVLGRVDQSPLFMLIHRGERATIALVFAPAHFGEDQGVLIQQDQINFPLTAVEVALYNGQPLFSQPFRGTFSASRPVSFLLRSNGTGAVLAWFGYLWQRLCLAAYEDGPVKLANDALVFHMQPASHAGELAGRQGIQQV